MIDIFLEETVRLKDSVLAGKKFKRTKLLSYMFLSSAIFFTVLLFIVLSINPEAFDEGFSIGDYYLFNVLPLFVFCVIFYTLYIVLRIKKHNYLVDYDYTFISGELRIAKVLNGLKRKPVAKIDCRDISVLGKRDSDKFLRHKSTPGVKTIIATPNEYADGNEDNLYFIVCRYKGEQCIIVFEPSANMLINIKKFTPRTVDLL